MEPKVDPDDTTCNERTVFWPDEEACDAVCTLPEGHEGPHEDFLLGEWGE